MLPHPLTNLEIHSHFQHEPRFYDLYSRDNLPKTQFYSETKDGAYVIKSL